MVSTIEKELNRTSASSVEDLKEDDDGNGERLKLRLKPRILLN